VKYFHCGYGFGPYTNHNWFTSTITLEDARHVRIHSVTADDRTACTWNFFPDHAEFTLERIASTNWWFLYECTPGGRVDVGGDCVVRAAIGRGAISEPWEIAEPPWVCFGAAESLWGLLMVNHNDFARPATYVCWPYQKGAGEGPNRVTVSGWGRLGWRSPDQHHPQLTRVPARFDIAVVSSDRALA